MRAILAPSSAGVKETTRRENPESWRKKGEDEGEKTETERF
jgi:hypothetical protein